MIRTLTVFLSTITLFLMLTFFLRERLASDRALSLKSNFRAQINSVMREDILKGSALKNIRISNDGNRVFGLSGNDQKGQLVLIEQGLGRTNIAELSGELSNLDISDEGDRAVFLLQEKQGKKLYFWEDGFNAMPLIEKNLPGEWKVHFSGLGNRIALVAKSETENSLLVTLGRRKSEGAERQTTPSGLPNVTVETIRANSNAIAGEVSGAVLTQLAWQKDGSYKRTQTIIKKQVSPQDVDGDKSSDFLIFGPGRELPYFQAYTSSGFDGATKQVAGISGYKANWRVGDNSGIPFTGDFDGDGFEDLGTLTPNFAIERKTEDTNWLIYLSEGTSLLDRHSKQMRVMKINWGFGDVRAVPADYDGDGTTDIGIYQKEAGLWQLLYSGGGFNAAKAIGNIDGAGLTVFWGQGGVPVPGDYNGDGLADICSYIEGKDGEKGRWQVLLLKDKGRKLGKQREFRFGQPGDIPISGDFNCNGKSDLVLYRPSERSWHFRFGGEDIKNISWSPKVPGELKPVTGDFDGDNCSDIAYVSVQEGKLVSWHVLPSSLAGGVIDVLGEQTNTIINLAFGRPIDRPVSLLLREHQQE